MARMKRTKLLKPYKEDGSTTFPARHLPGVYLIYRSNLLGERLRYVGYSGRDVYKALYRHFQEWNDRQAARGERTERITYTPPGAYRVRVIYTKTGHQARELESALILCKAPPDNADKLKGYMVTTYGVQMVTKAEDAEFTDNLDAPF